jgi:polyisoprenoid-binding protein YceI
MPAAAALLVAVASAGALAADFALDPAHTNVHFAVSHFDISFVRGRFAKVSGKIEFDPERKAGTVDVRVDPDSIDTGNNTLDQVLRSAQYLDTGQFGEVRYSGNGFVYDGDKLTAVDGTLILRNVARPVRLTVQRFVCKDVRAGIVTRYVCGGEFRTTIKRSDFGMSFMLRDVGDEVMLIINVEATRQ